MTAKLPVKTFQLKRHKKYGLVLATLLNLAASILFMWTATHLRLGPGRFILGLLAIFAFGLFFFTLYSLIVLVRDHFAGMLISSQGINDISTGHSYGVVQWKSVTKIKVVTDIEYPDRKYIILKVVNPQLYINRERSIVKKRSMILKYHHYGSPVVFSERGIDCSFEELETTVRAYHENFLVRKSEKRVAGRAGANQ